MMNQRKKTKPKESSVLILKQFRFSTPMERLMILFALICSAGAGTMKAVSIIFYVSFISNVTISLTYFHHLMKPILPVIHTMIYMSTAILMASYISSCF